MIDDDEEIEVGLIPLSGVRLVDPAAAGVAAVKDDLEDARLLLPGGGRDGGRVSELFEQDLDHTLQLALLGGRKLIEVGAHYLVPTALTRQITASPVLPIEATYPGRANDAERKAAVGRALSCDVAGFAETAVGHRAPTPSYRLPMEDWS
jgi:hypothetical protein